MNEIITINPRDIEVIEPEGRQINQFGWLQREAPKRYSDTGDLIERLRERSAIARTEIVENKDIEFVSNPRPETRDDLNQLAVKVQGEVVGLTHWSFGQVASLAGAPAGYLRSLPADMVKDALEWGLRVNRDVEDVKPYWDGRELRAVTGPGYGRVDDYQVAEAVATILDDARWEPADAHMGLSVTDRSLSMFMIDKSRPVVVGKAANGEDDVLYRGLRVFNSELGYSSLGIEAFLFRSYCLNGMIFGKSETFAVSVRHSKNAPARWAREVQPAIEAYANEDGSTLVEQVEKVKATKVASDNDEAVDFMRRRGIAARTAREAIKRIQDEEGTNARSAWDVVQGLTSVARDIPTLEERAELEKTAGLIFEKAAA